VAKSWVEMTGSDLLTEWHREPSHELLAEFLERVVREAAREVREEREVELAELRFLCDYWEGECKLARAQRDARYSSGV
jgi:hypothetical protein